jgi:DNA-binding CsgD family transcriptional regulator
VRRFWRASRRRRRSWAREPGGLVAYVEALAAEAEGDLSSAFETLRCTWERDLDLRWRYHHGYLDPALVRVALELGETQVAHDVAEVATRAATLAPEVASVQAVALRCRGLVDDDPDLLLEAVELVRRGPRVLDLAGACEDAAPVLAGAGQVDEAKALLTEALDRYEAAGATAWAARVSAGLRQLGVRRGVRGERQRPAEGWESLTPTELLVSGSVAEGLTNREVARRLHMSPHTVNTHLRHVYRKLGIANRAGLVGGGGCYSSGPGPA